MGHAAASPVYWTIRARRRLDRSLYNLAAASAPGADPDPGPTSALAAPMQDLNHILSQCFPGCAVIVQDEMVGYRANRGQHILLVEVCDPNEQHSGSYVVKIGPARDLEREVAGWNSCRPAGLRNDLVFLPLEARYRDPEGTPAPRLAIVYGDAQQFLGVQTTVPLESAVLDCVRYGLPTLASVCEALVQMYERIGHLLYVVSAEESPDRDGHWLCVPRSRGPGKADPLREALAAWDGKEHLRLVRMQVDALVARLDHAPRGAPLRRYLGPVTYLRRVLEVAGQLGNPPPPDAAAPAQERPPPTPKTDGPLKLPRSAVIPGLLRGRAHGDLHGRNVLIGAVRDRVLWPTVFDYEHMGEANFIGWDFVKLETELKIRAYDLIFPHHEPDFIRKVHEFEVELALQTEGCHADQSWPLVAELSAPAERLKAVVLQIRQLAGLHLGINQGRPRRWLEEYYFLLTCYGVVTGRFENLHNRLLIGSLVSAAVAASRLSWPRLCLEEEWRALHLSGEAGEGQGMDTAEEVLSVWTLTYDAPLEKARRWRQSGREDLQREAVKVLEALRERYPYALAVGQELVLALVEVDPGRAEVVLHGIEQLLRHPNEELLCRWGRLFKNEGDHAHPDLTGLGGEGPDRRPDPRRAEAMYARAQEKYQAAYGVRGGHYPGINVATLLLVRAGLARRRGREPQAVQLRDEAQKLARQLLAGRDGWPRDHPDDQKVWHPATEAEARLLTKEWDRAAELYRGIKAGERDRWSMRDQAERLRVSWQLLGEQDVGWLADPAPVFALARDEKAAADGGPPGLPQVREAQTLIARSLALLRQDITDGADSDLRRQALAQAEQVSQTLGALEQARLTAPVPPAVAPREASG